MDQGGSSSYVEMFYEAHVENGLINGFFAASVYIIVCMTMDRYYSPESYKKSPAIAFGNTTVNRSALRCTTRIRDLKLDLTVLT